MVKKCAVFDRASVDKKYLDIIYRIDFKHYYFYVGKTVFFSLWIKVDWVYRIARRKNKANILAR
ncbi:MAG: hypothetical protein ABS23_00435 [SAR92 bacterium BACL16 MAG-120619-bin48]|nr:MAG: hypothetical protein ABS23_00435 [SAR92 bacterium BACL16 MAG-120619-bin48]